MAARADRRDRRLGPDLARAWSAAFFDHSATPDAIPYPSRLNEQRNIALYARALGKLAPEATLRLIERRDVLAAIIRDFDLEII